MNDKPCTELVTEYVKYKSKRYTKVQIRKYEKIENPTILERYQLCENYRSLCHIEGFDTGIYDLCKECKHNIDEEARRILGDPDCEYEIIWGNIYKK